MRKLEFRFWAEDKMCEVEIFDELQQEHVMQFTGLKDKNGKEIWEGDIVEIVADGYKNTYTKCRVGWYFDGYKCFTKLTDDEKWDNGQSYEDWSDDVDWAECIVIGNIYENPELIKN